jgi:REP element-mobilizing transposase RayT
MPRFEARSTSRSRGFPASASHDGVWKLRRFGLEGDCYHVTAATRKRQPVFVDPAAAQVVFDALQFIRIRRAYLLAYAIMPDHLHALVVPRPSFTLSQLMQTLKGFSSRRINQIRGTRGPLWQQGYYDRVIRDDDQLETAIEYIEHNPVSAGIVAATKDYLWSSAHADATTDLEAWLTE